MVSIAAFQAVDPGSIAGHRMNFFVFLGDGYIMKKVQQKTQLKGEME
jgi:hypothetical protein